ncbi:hypothetical protein ABIE69_002647 [Rhodobacteraceae bacterium MBR-64]
MVRAGFRGFGRGISRRNRGNDNANLSLRESHRQARRIGEFPLAITAAARHSGAMTARQKSVAAPPSAPVPAAVPAWLRRALRADMSADTTGAALAAGAALGALDLLVRRQEVWAGVWRQRLALRAAAISARRVGRPEDEAGLRDAVMFTRPGDDPGPGGAILVAWQRLAARPASTLSATLSGGGDAGQAAAFGPWVGPDAGDTPLPDAGGIVAALAADHGADHAPWLADLRLARALGWRVAVPLLGTQPRTRPRTPAGNREAAALQALARAAVQAVDLGADLGRRADRLAAVAPKLRARGAAAVVARLLEVDAMSAAQPVPGMSDRGLRRLFDRLVDLGALRELTGRGSFRLYGL